MYEPFFHTMLSFPKKLEMYLCLGSTELRECMINAASSSAKMIISYLATSLFKNCSRPGRTICLFPLPKMYSDFRRVPVKLRTKVLGWTRGCTGSASNFFDGGYVTNWIVIDVLMPFHWRILRFLWPCRWRRVQLRVNLKLVFFYRGVRRGRHYRTIVRGCPRRRSDRSTIPPCFYSILNYWISTLIWHFVVLWIFFSISSFSLLWGLLTLGFIGRRCFLLFFVGAIRKWEMSVVCASGDES